MRPAVATSILNMPNDDPDYSGLPIKISILAQSRPAQASWAGTVFYHDSPLIQPGNKAVSRLTCLRGKGNRGSSLHLFSGRNDNLVTGYHPQHSRASSHIHVRAVRKELDAGKEGKK